MAHHSKLHKECLAFIEGQSTLFPSINSQWILGKSHPSRVAKALSFIPIESQPFFTQNLHPFPSLFFSNILCRQMISSFEKRLLPLPDLDTAWYGPLLEVSFPLFEKIPLLLGLYDLAQELQTTLDAQIVTMVQKSLSRHELAFIKKIVRRQKIARFEPLGLTQWNQQEKSLRSLLTVRGIYRLSRAITREDDLWISYLELKLSEESAQLLHRFLEKRAPISIKDEIIEEIQLTLEHAHEVDSW